MFSQRSERSSVNDAGTLKILVIAILVGFICIALYATQSWNIADFASITAVGIMTAGACLLVGTLIGFLFGLPRTLQRDRRTSNSEQEGYSEAEAQEVSYRVNTNLEEISDWLTKIIVGLGLIQLTTVPGKLQQIADSLQIGLGGFPSSSSFAVVILVYFSICGFFLGYLGTRLVVAGALRRAELSFRNSLTEAISTLYNTELKLTGKQKQDVRDARQIIEKQLGLFPQEGVQLRKLQQNLDRLARRGSGPERANEVGKILAEVRVQTRDKDFGCEELDEKFQRNTPGDRLIALTILEEQPNLECSERFELALSSVKEPMGPQEQYLALAVIAQMVSSLNFQQRQEIRSAIEEQRYIIPANEGRWNLSRQILSEIDSMEDVVESHQSQYLPPLD
jgi:hypothetical protein